MSAQMSTEPLGIVGIPGGEDERPLNGDRLAVRRVRGDLFWDASSFAVTSLRVCFAACDAACDAARAFASV
jgi:hypothetical protein